MRYRPAAERRALPIRVLLLPWFLFGGLCAFASWAVAQDTASLSPPVAPTLPSPVAFAPAPFALPGSAQAAQKQLCGLLRRLDAIASAEALITGSDDQPTGLKLLLKCRPGHHFTPELVTTVARLAGDAVPGLPREALLITDAAGSMLYAQGQVQIEALTPPGALAPWVWLLGAVALACLAAVVVGTGARARNARRLTTSGWWKHLTARQRAGLLPALARERPEVIALVLAQLPMRTGLRLRRQLARRRVSVVEVERQPDPQVVQVVMQAVRSRL